MRDRQPRDLGVDDQQPAPEIRGMGTPPRRYIKNNACHDVQIAVANLLFYYVSAGSPSFRLTVEANDVIFSHDASAYAARSI
jgi:hypothetical protein